MKKAIFFIIIFHFFLGKCYNQSNEFIGAVLIGRTEAISYHLVFDILENNKVKGYTITDMNGTNEIKVNIEGNYYPKSKTLKFIEKSIIYDKSNANKDELCLLEVNGKFVKKFGKEIFEGTFKSKFDSTKVYCDNGKVFLTSPKVIYEVAKKASKHIDPLQTKDSLSNIINSKLQDMKTVDKIEEMKAGKILNINWQSDTIVFEIWDDKIEDGDRISVSVNDKIWNSDLLVTNKAKIISIPAEKQNNIKVTALTEGSHPPNTVKIYLVDKNKKHLILTNLKKGEVSQINIKK